MANTLTTTDNFNQAHVDRWLRKELLEIGERDALFERFANKSVMPQGLGDTVSWLRYNRLDLPTGTLTEGVPPEADQLSLNRITTTAAQYGQVVSLSDKLQIETNHDVLRVAITQVGESMAWLRDALVQEALINGTNVLFAGTANTARSALAAGDIIDTEDILRAQDQLENTNGVDGRASKFGAGVAAGMYAGVMHPRQALDLRSDTTWNDSAIRQDLPALKGSPFKAFDWEGVRWMVSNNMPTFENPGLPDAGGNAQQDGTFTALDAGGFLDTTDKDVVVTAKDRKRQHEEIIYTTKTVAMGALAGTDNSIDVLLPSDATRVYQVYVADTAGVPQEVARDQKAATTVTITALASATAKAAPPAPTVGVKTYAAYVFGRGAYGSVDLSGGALSAGFAQRGRTKDDPLDQLTKLGAKMFYATLVLNDNFLVRIETTSDFGN